MWTGSEVSRSIQRLSSSGEACTRWPSRVTGMPDLPSVARLKLAGLKKWRFGASLLEGRGSRSLWGMVLAFWISPCFDAWKDLEAAFEIWLCHSAGDWVHLRGLPKSDRRGCR